MPPLVDTVTTLAPSQKKDKKGKFFKMGKSASESRLALRKNAGMSSMIDQLKILQVNVARFYLVYTK